MFKKLKEDVINQVVINHRLQKTNGYCFTEKLIREYQIVLV